MGDFSESKLAAWMQIIVSRRRAASGLYREIAEKLPLEKAGRVLDIGTGTGLQLRAIHDLRPAAELYGLDISPPAIRTASQALGRIKADLRVEDIAATSFPDDFFDLVTCHSSLSYWKEPLQGLNEIHRILKPGGQALLFEPHQDIDIEAALDQIRDNMADACPLRRWAAVQLNRFALERGERIGMKLYSQEEMIELVQGSRFGDRSGVEKTKLLGIPIFICIRVWKPA